MNIGNTRKYIIFIALVLIECLSIFFVFKSFSNKEPEKIKHNNEINNNNTNFATYLEQNNGEYLETVEGGWPKDYYVLNNEKTRCLDSGGNEVNVTLSYDKENIFITTEKSVFCYIYFNIERICTLADDSAMADGVAGAKYNCKVDPNKDEYTFYLIDNNEDGTSNLIMNANINASGEAVIPGVTSDIGTVSWYETDTSSYGPVIAMTYLHSATKNWTNVKPLNFEYYDPEQNTYGGGYKSFISTNGIGIISQNDANNSTVTIGSEEEKLRTRLATKQELSEISKVSVNNQLYHLLINLDNNKQYNGPYGYWSLSSFSSTYSVAADVYGSVNVADIDKDDYHGVRPVITVKL